MFQMLFGGRYIILMMSIFSIYVGLIYNDIFSLCVFYAPSGWTYINETVNGKSFEVPKFQYAYPFGIDPSWRLAENSMVFMNSYKMKMSILIGVAHMIFGICLSLFNHRYFKKPINIIGEFIPQMIFLNCLFGYLCILIIYKWLQPADKYERAPGLLNTLIFMFLKPGTVDSLDQLYPGNCPIIRDLLTFKVKLQFRQYYCY
jgi:V-type H+-transporting ATPase subunit a